MELCSVLCAIWDGTNVFLSWKEECLNYMYMYGYMYYMYDWVPLLSTWNYHNIVN